MEKRLTESIPKIAQHLGFYSTTEAPSVAAVVDRLNSIGNDFLPAQLQQDGSRKVIADILLDAPYQFRFDLKSAYGVGSYARFDTIDDALILRHYSTTPGDMVTNNSAIYFQPAAIYIFGPQADEIMETTDNAVITKGYLVSYTNGFTPIAIKNAVKAGQWASGELLNTQPTGSRAGMKFCDASYRYEYMLSMSDTDGTSFIWVRTLKGS